MSAKKKKKTGEIEEQEVEFYWWEGKDLVPFFRAVYEYGPENIRISFNLKDRLLRIIPLGIGLKDGGETFNFSHPCPPFCGNGD